MKYLKNFVVGAIIVIVFFALIKLVTHIPYYYGVYAFMVFLFIMVSYGIGSIINTEWNDYKLRRKQRLYYDKTTKDAHVKGKTVKQLKNEAKREYLETKGFIKTPKNIDDINLEHKNKKEQKQDDKNNV